MLYVITVRILVRIYRTIVQYLLVVQSVVLCSAIEYSTRYSTVQYNTSMVGESEPSCYLQPHRLPAQVTSIKPQARATFHNSPATSHQPHSIIHQPLAISHKPQAKSQSTTSKQELRLTCARTNQGWPIHYSPPPPHPSLHPPHDRHDTAQLDGHSRHFIRSCCAVMCRPSTVLSPPLNSPFASAGAGFCA